MKQAAKRTEQRKPFKTRMKKAEKAVLVDVKKNDAEAAKKDLVNAYKRIDTAAKKNILHKKTAARKKSKLAKAVSGLTAAKKD